MGEEWGVSVSDPEKEFQSIDTNGGGQVLFEEFCAWAIKKGLDYDREFEMDKAHHDEVDPEKEQTQDAELNQDTEMEDDFHAFFGDPVVNYEEARAMVARKYSNSALDDDDIERADRA